MAIATLLYSPPGSDTPEVLSAGLERLERDLDAPCSVWISDGLDAWHCLRRVDEPPGDDVGDWLARNANRLASGPLTRVFGGECVWLAVPLGSSGDRTVVAVTCLPNDPETLAGKLGTLAFRAAVERGELCRQQATLEGYSQLVSQNLEEVTYLRDLARRLEVCHVRNDPAAVAVDILPTLRNLVSAEGLAFVGARKGSGAVATPGPVFASDGVLPADEDLRRLAADLAPAEGATPVIHNYHGLSRSLAGPAGVRSVLIVPVVEAEHTYGWLVALNRVGPPECPEEPLGQDEFGTVEASLLEASAVMLATHAGNVAAFGIQQKLLVDSIRIMSNLLDAKDPYTGGHSDRVATMSRQIAGVLGLEPAECETVYLAGLLHDIGKVGVPDDVLLKPGMLTPAEFDEIRKHPQRGYDILKDLEPLRPILPGVLYHHEEFDGSGYPMGLAGSEIPLIARILAVADSWDAMTSKRAYRPGMSPERAETILRDGAGTQWDSWIVDAFLTRVLRRPSTDGTSTHSTSAATSGPGDVCRGDFVQAAVQSSRLL